jgi:hypothetical protein
MASGTTVVHVTHEATGQVGGIGAVLQGLFTCPPYLDAIGRSILVSPLFAIEGGPGDRLGPDGEVLYSSMDGLLSPGYRQAFERIERYYNVGIVYGRRTFRDSLTGVSSSPEVLLIDVRHSDRGPVDEFKRRLFEQFGIQSHRYEHLWEYEQYVRLGPPAIAALRALGIPNETTLLISHEFMGMPTVLQAILDPCCDYRTVFYAHEVASVRKIVEDHPGHDTLFYNVMKASRSHNQTLGQVFGDQSTYFKHALVEASRYCDKIFAVGDLVGDELRFLAPEFEHASIHVVYNGVPAYEIDLAAKLEAKAKLQTYAERLLGWRPDTVFTHVTRLVRSKGLWRDLKVMEALDGEFKARNKTGVLLLLSTEVGQRRSSDILQMESSYGWPVAHREGLPDLSGGEASLYTAIQEFNARSLAVKVVFINQFGFDSRRCGSRMPEEMEFMDLRKGTDVEFGQSIYEPFGIAQMEPLTFGALCVYSNVCGCAGFYGHASKGLDNRNVILADYTRLANSDGVAVEDLIRIGQAERDRVEARESAAVAAEILRRLPQDEAETESLLRSGYAVANRMSWRVVVNRCLLNHFQELDERSVSRVTAC